jgi:MFS family permease
MAGASTERQNSKFLIGIILFCLGASSQNMTIGILANIMKSYPNVSRVLVQSLLVGPSLVGAIYGFFVGMLNRRFSSKKLLIFSQIGFFAYGMVFFLGGGVWPIWVLLLGSGLAGFSMGSYNTLMGLLFADYISDENKRGTLLGIGTALMSVGGVIITTLGGIIARQRWQNAYLLFFYYPIAIALELFLIPNMEPEGKERTVQSETDTGASVTQQAQMGKVWILAIHYFVFFLVNYVFGTNVSEYVIDTYKLGTSAEAGIAASCITIGGVLGGLLYGAVSRVLKRFTVPVMMGLGMIGLALPVFVTSSIVVMYCTGTLLGFAMFGSSPYIINYLRELAPGTHYGNAMSIFSGFMNAGQVLAIYVLAFFTQLVCGDASNIHYKFVVAFAGSVIVFVTAPFIYLPQIKKAA